SPVSGAAASGTIRASRWSACPSGRPRRSARGPAGDCRPPTNRSVPPGVRRVSSIPGGGDWEDAICNTVEARLGMTSAVGLFARARSKAFGLHDMAGNVLEWCRNIAADTTRDGGLCAVVRGGSWYDYAGDAWCAYRFVIPPIIRGGNLGFRMVDGGG